MREPDRDPSRNTDPFDLWLKRRLHERFDVAVEEPLPMDLLRLASDTRGEWETLKESWLADATEQRAKSQT